MVVRRKKAREEGKSDKKNHASGSEDKIMEKLREKENRVRKWTQGVLFLCIVVCMGVLLNPGRQVQAADEVRAVFTSEYAKPGQVLEVALEGDLPANCQYSYQWTVDGKQAAATGSAYQVTEKDLEKFIQATVKVTGGMEGVYTAKMYCSELPVMYVTTEGKIQNKEDYVNGTLSTQRNDAYQDATVYDGDIEIRYRGNSTLGFPKKPYKVKLGKKTDMFGFGKNKHWTLLANYLDGTFMRNCLSYDLSGEMGMPHMQSVDVILIMNGEYQGLYQFCEQIRVDYESGGNRVDIYDWESAAEDNADVIAEAEGFSKSDKSALEEDMLADLSWATTGTFSYNGKTYQMSDYPEIQIPSRTGGYLLELDEYFDEMSKFKSNQLSQPLNIKNPETANSSEEMMNYAAEYIDAFETAIQSYDFSAVFEGGSKSYSQLFDMDSLVDFWLVNELFLNEDAMKKSTFMYKDIDGLFFMGPIWDMDWSSAGEGDTDHTNRWQTLHFSANAQGKQWYKFIIQDPYFAIRVRERYLEIRDTLLESIVKAGGIMDIKEAYLTTAAVADMRFWGRFGADFRGQVSKLKSFLTDRLAWMDQQFASVETLMSSWKTYQPAKAGDGAVAASGNEVKVDFTVPEGTKRAALLVNGVYIGEASVSGAKASLVVNKDVFSGIERNDSLLFTYCCQDDKNTASYGYEEKDAAVIPDFKTVTVSAAEGGTAGILSDGQLLQTLMILKGDRISVKAEPEEGYQFAGWYQGQDLVSEEAEYTFAVDESISLEAKFEEKPPAPVYYRIQISAGEGGTAAILDEQGDVKSIEAEEGSKVVILASPSVGYTFDGWYENGNKVYVLPRAVLTVDRDQSMEARFIKEEKTEPSETNPAKPGAQSRSIKEAKVDAIADQAYTKKALKPKVRAAYAGAVLKEGTDYTLSYKNNKKTGKASVTLTGKGSYTGTQTVYFRIVPKKASIAKAAATGSRTIKVVWKKDKKAAGYQIQYCLKRSFKKGAKTINIKKNRTVSRDIKKLKGGKKYYVRVRAYKVIDGKKAYGAYSKIKPVRVNK